MAIQKKSSRMAEKERIHEDVTEEFSAHGTSNFSPLAVFKSKVHLSVCNADNEEIENEWFVQRTKRHIRREKAPDELRVRDYNGFQWI